jgi:FAD/FMN-containing dehydrogenase/Fe-S oxidoreductase
MSTTDFVQIRTEGNLNISDAPPPTSWDGDAARLEQMLRERVRGEVRFDNGSRAMYATDGSNYRQVPIGVVIPRDREDVIATVAACREIGAPILARGGGTSLAGQCCNVAVVLDFSKYMNQILEINKEEKYARVQPGVVLDQLRKEATKVGLTFGPDPATHDHCTLGGMIGNNSCGVHSIMSGRTADNVYELEVLLYDGTIMTVGETSEAEYQRILAAGGRRAEIYQQIRNLRDRVASLVETKYPHIPRRVSGYNFDNLLAENGFNVARGLVGSECTLVLVLEAKLKLIHNPAFRTLAVLGYDEVYHAADHVPEVMKYGPIGLEGMDYELVSFMKDKNVHIKDVDLLPPGKGWLLVEFGGDSQQEADDKALRMLDALKAVPNAPTQRFYDDKVREKQVWEIRESALGATAFVPGKPLAWEGWEDSAVDPAKLGHYLRELCSLMESYGYHSTMYGHFGHGCVHMRINFDLCSAEGIEKYRRFIHDAAHLCVKYGGSLSGEHGDGQSRGELLPIMFGDELVEAFHEYKRIWDPDWKMNPGKIVKAYRADENLRLGAHYDPWEPKTHFTYPEDEGSFARAALRCVGVGKCRRHEGGTMCPSYRVTMDEEHATRGRAHLLWEMAKGDTITDGWKDESIFEALDLCLACKGCKGDCPVNVDVATYKAEFLSHYYEGKRRPIHAYAFGYVDLIAELGSLMPGVANLVTQLPGLSSVVKSLGGFPQERRLPPLAPEAFTQWWKRRPRKTPRTKRVMLWPDTFNNYFFPSTAQAATEVFEYAGYEVVLPKKRVCCGRPLYDFGMLDRAKRLLHHDLDVVADELERGTEIVGLEPSCVSVFRDELPNLMPNDKLAGMMRKQTKMFTEFLSDHQNEFEWPRLERTAVVHGHCHQKSLMKMETEETALKKMGMNYEMPDNGCCGLAGSFGFEKEKYETSIKIADKELTPHLDRAKESTFVIANGFSCREQIEHVSGRRGLHIAEVMQMAIHSGPNGPTVGAPERELIERHEAEVRKSMARAAAGIGTIAALGLGAWLFSRKR